MCCWRKTWRLFTSRRTGLQAEFFSLAYFLTIWLQALSGIFPDRFQFGVRPVAGGYMAAVFLAKRLDQGIAALLADFAVAVTLAAIESFRIMFVAHISMCVAPVMPVLRVELHPQFSSQSAQKSFTRPRTS